MSLEDDLKNLREEMSNLAEGFKDMAKVMQDNAKQAVEFTQDSAEVYKTSFKDSIDLADKLSGYTKEQLKDGRSRGALERKLSKSKQDQARVLAKIASLSDKKLNPAFRDQIKYIDAALRVLKDVDEQISAGITSAEELVGTYEKLEAANPFKGLSDFVKDIPVLNKVLDNMVVAADKFNEVLVDTENKQKALAAGFKEYGKLISKAASVFIISELIKGIKSIDESSVNLSNQMMISKTEAGRLAINYAKAADANNELLQSSRDLMKAQAELGTMLGTSAMFSYDMVSTFDILTNRMGVSAENAGSLAEFTAATGQNFSDFSEQIAGTVKMENALEGSVINQREIYQDIANLSSATRLSMQAQGQNLAKAAFEARKLGLNLADMEKIGSSLLDFESSIASELEAELITGKELNLERARAAFLNNDMATFTAEIAKNVGTAADFAKMNRIAQEATAKAFGMQRDEFADMLVSQEALKAFAKDNLHSEKEVVDEIKRRLAAGESYASLVQEYGKNELLDRAKNISMQEKLNKLIEKMVDFATKYLVPVFEGIDKFLTNASSHAKLIGGGLLALAVGGPIIKGVMMIARLFRGIAGSSGSIASNLMKSTKMGGPGGAGGGMNMMPGFTGSQSVKSGTDKFGNTFHYDSKTGRRMKAPKMPSNLSRMSKVTKGFKAAGKGFAPLALLGAGMDVASNFSDDSLTGGEAALKSVDQNKGMITGAIIGSIVPGLGTVVGAGIGGIIDMFAPEVGTYGDDAKESNSNDQIARALDEQTKQLTVVLNRNRSVSLNTVNLQNRQNFDYRTIN
jgi:hypothetical protein